MSCCPTCGRALDDNGPPIDRLRAELSPTQQRLLNVVHERPGISAKDLFAACYGPKTDPVTMRTTLARANRHLAHLGWRISARRGAGYHIQRAT